MKFLNLLILSFVSWQVTGAELAVAKENVARHMSSSSTREGYKAVLEPIERLTLSSPESGVLTFSAKDGASIKKGALLFSIADDVLKMEAKTLSMKLNAFASEIKYFSNVVSNRKKQLSGGVVNREDLLSSEHEVTRLANQKDITQSEFKKLGEKIKTLSVHAPFEGIVSVSYKKTHEFSQVGQPIIEFLNSKKLLAVLPIPQSKLNTLKVGANAEIQVGDEAFPATITYISPEVDYAAKKIQIKVVIDNALGRFRPGMACKVYLNE